MTIKGNPITQQRVGNAPPRTDGHDESAFSGWLIYFRWARQSLRNDLEAGRPANTTIPDASAVGQPDPAAPDTENNPVITVTGVDDDTITVAPVVAPFVSPDGRVPVTVQDCPFRHRHTGPCYPVKQALAEMHEKRFWFVIPPKDIPEDGSDLPIGRRYKLHYEDEGDLRPEGIELADLTPARQ